jgi:Secretion system C-terminal sorting domain
MLVMDFARQQMGIMCWEVRHSFIMPWVIKVYDILGKELYSGTEHKSAGTYQITLDGTNYASGLYFYRVESGSFVETKKMVLVK